MKEQMTYVAIDADDVGQSIGGAVLSDDINRLSSLSVKINAGVQIFSKWAEYNGGKVISSGSDEAIFEVPVKSIEELEDLKNRYQEKTGFSISIGIGERVSDAAKALIYAKVNGKNQIVDYSPEIEEAMKQSISGKIDQIDSGVEEQKLEGGVGDETEESDVDDEQLEMGKETEKEHTSDKGQAKEIALDHLTEDPEYYSKLQEMESEDEEDSEDMEDLGDLEEMPEEDEEEMEDEEGEEEMPEEDMEDEEESDEEEMPENIEDSQEDLDVDGRPDIEEEHGKIDPEEDDIDQDGDVEHEEALANEAGEEEEYSDSGDEEDEYLADAIESEMEDEEDQEMPEEDMSEEEMSEEDMEDMSEEDQEMPEEMSQEEMPEEDMSQDSLKQAIMDSLQIFKQNRELLNSLASENPDLYNALVVSLQAMIEMGRELGFGESLGEEEQAPEEELNPADFEVSEEEPSSEDLEAPEESEEDMGKNEIFMRLVKKINVLDMNKNEKKKEFLLKLKQKLKDIKSKSNPKQNKKSPFDDKDKKKPKPKKVEAASFCANSNQKMKTSGKDCRSGEDKDSPMCVARKKMNCRGKNAEKGPAIQKSEKLKNFLEKNRKK
jgi:hypothetical protein